ncbi:MAG: hypothetical protein AAF657_37890, partial [Acidobacteriota bacterium]
MSCHLTPCHPMQCIMPPHMLESLRMRGDEKMRKMCDTLEREADKARASRQEAAPPHSFRAARRVVAGASANLDRTIFDAKKRATLPGTAVRSEGDPPTGDDQVDAAYDGSGDTY